MAVPIDNKVKQKLAAAEEKYFRLVLLVGESHGRTPRLPSADFRLIDCLSHAVVVNMSGYQHG